MTPNEWYDKAPFAEEIYNCDQYGEEYVEYVRYDIPAIIEEVKRRERKTFRFAVIDGYYVCENCNENFGIADGRIPPMTCACGATFIEQPMNEEVERRERGETKIVRMKDGSEKRMCGACENHLPLSFLMVLPPRFCPHCGLKIKWD